MNCEEIRMMMVDEDDLNPSEQVIVRQHMETCSECRAVRESMRHFREHTAGFPGVDISAVDPARFTKDVMTAIGSADERSPQGQWIHWMDAARVTWITAAASLPQAGSVLTASVMRPVYGVSRRPIPSVVDPCRNPFRKPARIAECLRQKYGSIVKI
jgi:hypothetical protein